MSSNRVRFCPAEKKIEVIEPKFVHSAFDKLSIGDEKKNSHFVQTSSTGIKIKSHYSNQQEKFDLFLLETVGNISLFCLKQKDCDEVYKLMGKLVNAFSLLLISRLGDLSESITSNLTDVQDFVLERIHKYDSSFKRKKDLMARESYVAPIEKAIGLKWKTKGDIKTGLPDHTITQPTFQYVPILNTLKSLFVQQTFRQTYFDSCFNSHKCEDGIYKQFCCSSVCRDKEIFRDKTTLKICIGVDDFDPCDALKSKAVIHKICAFYFTIGNMPDTDSSKNENMKLIALCDTVNIKQENTSYNDIISLIVSEIAELETTGIRVGDHVIKGTIIYVIGDNLGANGFCGYIESFNGIFCRACDVNKKESETITKEERIKLRTKESYIECVNEAEQFASAGKKVDYKITKGVKRSCSFNSLKYFHIIDNVIFDIMHDVDEGVIPFLLSHIFNYFIDEKIVPDIVTRVRDFTYGAVGIQNKPTLLNLDRKNLGQNASQSHCLLINLPFILADKKEELGDIWLGVESLLRIVEIIYSKEIRESDIEQLTVFIEQHLQWVLNFLEESLRPKHHFMTHYPSSIRRMGPLINYWMMRVDSKHQFFTHVAKNTNNFINLTKTMAEKHQAFMAYKPFRVSQIQPSKLSNKFDKTDTKYENFISRILGDENRNELLVHDFATFNSFHYRAGLMIIIDSAIYEIVYVFLLHDEVLIFCRPFRVVKFESFYNSFEILCDDESEQFKLVNPMKLNNMKTYEKKIVQDKMYIFSDTLTVRRACCGD